MRELGLEIAEACAAPPECIWDDANAEPIAPTLARHAEPDEYIQRSRADLEAWATAESDGSRRDTGPRVDLVKPDDVLTEIAATLLYPVCSHSFRALYETLRDWSPARRGEVLDVALQSRGSRDDFLRGFRGGQYCFDMLIDIGAYRDMHRHRRCHQYRQAYSGEHGYESPAIAG